MITANTFPFSPAQVLAFAPDPASAKAGQDLAKKRSKWVNVGRNDAALWGECQGSGSNPYQTIVDLAEPAFKCTCPSHKFPCKHGLGLLLIAAQEPDSVAVGENPDWVNTWLESREARKRKAEKAPDAAKAPDIATQAKRVEAREEKIAGGLAELESWLSDILRHGIADDRLRGRGFWSGMAARLVDAQAPGLARMVGDLDGLPATGHGWQDVLLERMGRIHLAINAYRRQDTLSAAVRDDIRAIIGWPVTNERLSTLDGVNGAWLVAGGVREERDDLIVRRTWLYRLPDDPLTDSAGDLSPVPNEPLTDSAGDLSPVPNVPLTDSDGDLASALDRPQAPDFACQILFSHAAQPATEQPPAVGTVLRGEIVYYPSAWPSRAALRNTAVDPVDASLRPAGRDIAFGYASAAEAVAANPWIERHPWMLSAVTPVRDGDGWLLRDASGHGVAISKRFANPFRLAAVSAGLPITLFGEWDGSRLLPCGVMTSAGWRDL